MNILLIVNESPWRNSLAMTAFRFADTVCRDSGHQVAVYFRGDGVYNALEGSQTDPGATALTKAWMQLAESYALDLIICSADSARRFPQDCAENLPPAFRQSGLAEVMEMIGTADRVMTF